MRSPLISRRKEEEEERIGPTDPFLSEVGLVVAAQDSAAATVAVDWLRRASSPPAFDLACKKEF